MRFIDNRGVTDPHVNLALEEYVFRNKPSDDDCLLFYVNSPSIIIGRNQNTIEEVNPVVVAERGIQVVRRISGGGAVYHDLGNLNFSILTPHVSSHFSRYDHFTKPVTDVLRDMGVPAELGGRNDILVDGRKISGNAQFARHDRMFSHGTLLLDSGLDELTRALNPRPGKVESKGVKSIRSRVANIAEFMPEPLGVEELRERIIERIFGTRDRAQIPAIELTEADWAGVHELVATKYGTWDWNYGQNPASNVQRARRFPIGEIDVRLDVQEGLIVAARFFGDYMGRAEVGELERRLVGVRHDGAAVAAALEGVDASLYFGDVALADIIELVAP